MDMCFGWTAFGACSYFTCIELQMTLYRTNTINKKKLADLSMLHKAKKAYYACDVIRFLVP